MGLLFDQLLDLVRENPIDKFIRLDQKEREKEKEREIRDIVGRSNNNDKVLNKGFFDFVRDNVVIVGSDRHTEYMAPKLAHVLKKHGITCHCGGLAVPNMRKGKIYKCIKCDKQFANAHYTVYSDSSSYSEKIHSRAIAFLKN